jgi:hypothetical protein
MHIEFLIGTGGIMDWDVTNNENGNRVYTQKGYVIEQKRAYKLTLPDGRPAGFYKSLETAKLAAEALWMSRKGWTDENS